MFADAIATLEKLGGWIVNAAQIPKRQREKYLAAVTEAFTLLDTALVMVQMKLGDLLHIQNDFELDTAGKKRRFVQDLANLDNTEAWLRLERELSLCRSLRIVSRDMDYAAQEVLNTVALNDRRAVEELISDIFERERFLAEYIGNSFEKLAAMAPDAARSADGRKAAWRAVKAKHELLKKEQRQLREAELRFLAAL